MRTTRSLSAIGIAILAHAAGAFAIYVVAPSQSLARVQVSAPIAEDLLIELEDERPVEPAVVVPDGPSAPIEPAHAATHATRGTTIIATSSVAADHSTAGPSDSGAIEPPPADSGSISITRPAPNDLGIGTYWKRVATSGAPSPPSAEDRARPSQPTAIQSVRDGLDAHDRALGLTAGGALAAVARDAASATIAPDVGVATFDIECDAAGRVVSARVVAASSDAAAWNAVARELVRLMAAKSVRVPAGAKGMRARVRVTALRTLPSGSKSTVSPGAVPDDVPGSDPVCVGEGSKRWCAAGMPVGVTASSVDVANVGASATRIVRAMLLNEERL